MRTENRMRKEDIVEWEYNNFEHHGHDDLDWKIFKNESASYAFSRKREELVVDCMFMVSIGFILVLGVWEISQTLFSVFK